jgi:CysZ protein
MTVSGALLYGFANLLHPRMLWLMLWPMLVAVAIWGTVAFAMWMRVAFWLAGLLKQWFESAAPFVHIDIGGVALIMAHVALILLFVPLVYLTALFILGIFGMQKMVDYVAARSFPALERRKGGSAAGSAWNAVVALFGMAGLFLASIPLWIIPPFWPVIPVVILAWGNQRLLRYDALAEHADGAEMARLFHERRGGMYLLGLLLAIAVYIPVVGFFAPVAFGLAFIRYLLGALEALRQREGRST